MKIPLRKGLTMDGCNYPYQVKTFTMKEWIATNSFVHLTQYLFRTLEAIRIYVILLMNVGSFSRTNTVLLTG